MIGSSKIESDEDAFEALICLFAAGKFDDALSYGEGYRWKANWAAKASRALSGLIRGIDPVQSLSLARSAIAQPGAACDAMAIFLILLQVNGLASEASAYIQTHLEPPPGNEILLSTVMGEIAVAMNDWPRAYSRALSVLSLDFNNFRALVILAIASYEFGNTYESLGYARRANHINPRVPVVTLQLMRCQNKIADYYAALASFNGLGDAQAVTPEIYAELGVAYSRLGFRDRAINAYQKALATPRKPMLALQGLLRIFIEAGIERDLREFIKQHHADIKSDMECVYLLALHCENRSDLDASFELLRESLALSIEQEVPLSLLQWPVPEPRLRHDYEQLELLERRGKLPASAAYALPVLRRYVGQGARVSGFAPADAKEAALLRKALTDIHYCPDLRFSGTALGVNDYGSIEDMYCRSSPSLVVIDNFLTAAALSSLREFCEEATIWRSYKDNGYMGTTLGGGFSPRVLLAIADELRQAMPKVIGQHALTQAWAFKYDQGLQGINLHGDFAVVNVNFWITPEAACEDLATGGMVIYDVPTPRHWTFEDYNGDPGKLEALVRENNAKPTRIPYRENRCVLFDSTLLHTTDEFHFKPGYTNRRVNVTFLYGRALNND